MPGPSDLQPVVTLSRIGLVAAASWPPLPQAYLYHVEVADAGGAVVYAVEIDAATYQGTPVPLSSATFTPAAGMTYTVEVRVTGVPSAPQSFTVPTAPQLLADLRDRLIAARTQPDVSVPSYRYALDDTVLPGTGDGDPGAVAITLRAALTAGMTSAPGTVPAITSASGPVLSTGPDALTLTGTAAALTGDPATAAAVVFTVSEDLSLRASWTSSPADGSGLADVFDSLDESEFGYLPLHASAYAATTFAHADPGFFFPLQPGLQFQASLLIRGDLIPAGGDPAEPGVAQVRIGGAVQVSDDGRPQFAWAGEATLGPLTVARTGQPPLTLEAGTVQLATTPTDGPEGSADVLTITGQVTMVATPLTCVVNLPTALSPELTLRAVSPALPPATASDALAAGGTDDVLAGYLPATLLGLTGIGLTGFGVTFYPAGDGPTATTLTLSFGDATWPLIPALNLAISGLVLRATVTRAPAYLPGPVLGYSGQVSGLLTLGGTRYAIEAAIPADGGWYVQIVDTGNVPTLANLAALTGLTAAQVTSVLPAPLLALGSSFTLSRIALLADPATQRLGEVSFRLAQTQPWPLAGGLLTLSDWTADIVIGNGDAGWTTSGLLQGSVGLTVGATTTTLNVHLPVPIGEDTLWTFALDEGSTVQLPTIGHVLSLLGATLAALPTGLSTLGGLDVRHFTVSLDPAAATLVQVAVAFDQTSDWVIISGALTITGVSASLAFRPATTPAGVTCFLQGTLVLAGQSVDVVMLKNDVTDGWLLQAGHENFVHVPGFTALDAWLAPGEASGGLPATLPLAAGFEVGQVFLAFAGDATGALEQFGFTVYADNLWTVVPGYLSLTRVSATLVLACPVTADTVTGTVAGVATIGGVDIAVGAAKPATTAPWEFTGALVDGLTVDLVDSADALTAATLALPADATSYGLPAAIIIESAQVRAIPDTGLLHFEGSAAFDWQFPLGPATLAVRSIGGTIDIPETGAPLSAGVTGTFDFAGIHVVLSLRILGAAAQTVLTGTLTPADAANIQISGITDPIAAGTGAQRWASVAPSGLAAPTFTGAALYLNLTTSRFLLYGAVGSDTGLSAQAMVYLAPAAVTPPATGAAPWTYAVALSLGPNFRFATLLPALAIVDGYLHVAQARLVVCNLVDETLGRLSQATGTLLAGIDPSLPAPLAGLDGQAQSLAIGAYFTAQLDFGAVTLFSRLLQIGTDAAPPSVRLSALIDQGDPTRTVFGADLPDITILDTITLTHTDAYPGIHLSYAPAQASRFELAGRIALTGIFGAGLQFDVALTVDDTGLTSTIRQTAQQIANPFGLPGIVLSGLGLAVTYTWAAPATQNVPARPQTSKYILQGTVLLGPAPLPEHDDQRLSCTGRLALRGGTPALVYVALTQDFSIGAFLAQCVTGSGANWPTGFLDVTLRSGTRIYYYSRADDPNGNLATLDGYTFTDGFHVDAQIEITLIAALTLHGVLSVLRDPVTHDYIGVRAGIQLDNPVDLVFLALASSTPPAAGHPYTGGPLLAFQTGDSPTFGLAAGINFLGAAFLAAQVTVTRGGDSGTIFTGRLTAAQPLAPFGTLSCGFSYTTHPGRDGEFQIVGWPDFTWVRDIVDFVQAIKDLADTSDGSPCGTLADFVVSNAYHSSYSISPSVSASGTNLIFALTGTYAITITGATDPFLNLTLPAFSVPIPSTTTWSSLPDALAGGVAGASAQFARDLLSQPDKIALLLAMIVGPRAATVALELACNALVDGAAAAAADAAATAIAAAGGAAAAGAAGAAVGAIAAALAGSGGGDGGGGGGGGAQVATPNLRGLTFAGVSFTGHWDGAQGASGYLFQVLRPDGSVLGSSTVGYVLSTGVAADPASLAAGTYQGQVQGTRGTQTSGWSTLPIVKPAGVAATLSYPDPELTASWADATADGYVVRFFAPGGAQIGADIGVPGATLQASVVLPDPEPGGYGVQVQANRNGQIPGVFGAGAPLEIVTLPAPAIAAVNHADDAINVSWTPLTQPVMRYEVQVRAGTTLLASATGPAASAVLPAAGTPFASGITYTVAVRAHGQGAVSAWSQQDFLFLTVPSVAQPALTNDIGELTAAWAAVTLNGAPTATYDLQLIDLAAPAAPVATLSALTGTTAQVTRTDGQPPADGSRYQVRVRADIAGNLGPWTVSAALAVVELTVPTGVVLTAAASTLTLAWSAPVLPASAGGPLTYDMILAVISGPGGPTVDVGEQTGIAGTSLQPARADHRPPTPGEAYAARVRAVLPGNAGPWAASATVAVLDSVQIVRAVYLTNTIQATWTPSTVPGAGYEINAAPAGGAGPGPTTSVPAPTNGPAATTASVDMTGQPRDVSYNLRVRAVLPGSTGPWSPSRPVLVLDPPAGLTLSYPNAQLTAAWNQVTGASGYRLTINDPTGTAVQTSDVSITAPAKSPPTTATLPETGLAHNVSYTVTVATLIKGAVSAPSASVPLTILDPPAGITAGYDGTHLNVSWQPVTGAVSYAVQITDLDNRVVATQSSTATSIAYSGSQLVPGVNYQVQVGAAANVPGPWSAPVPVAQSAFTCLCLGVSPGSGCGNNGVGDNFTGVFLNVTQSALDTEFFPTRTPNRSGWVSVPPGRSGPVAVLARLVALLTTKGILTGTDPFDVFTKSPPSEIRSMSGTGTLTCLCLGVSPGTGCGNNGIGDNFSGVFTNITQAEVDSGFHPTRVPSRTGWVTVGNTAYIPLEVLLQLVTLLTNKNRLAGDEPFNVFNQAMSGRVREGSGGPTTCVALGSPVGQACTTMGGGFGDVVVNVATADVSALYQPGPGTGWATIAQADHSVLTATLQLVNTLFQKGVLAGSEPYDVFNNATAAGVR